MIPTANKLLLLLLFLLIFCLLSIAQPPGCGTDEHSRKLWNTNPAVKQKQVQEEAKILAQRLSQRQHKIAGVEEYSIPVVVHIIHQNGYENISDAQVLSGIQHLNEAFANEGVYKNAKGIETGIKFCLARQDEYGNASSGITRTVSPLTNMLSPSQDLALKNLIRWNPSMYINIWLVNEITSESSGPAVAGYAYLPSAHGMEMDGVVNEARYFGSSTDNSKVHIHELGHYLGLYHTFEGACTNNDCQTDGDKVCDTPPDASVAPTLCNVPMNTCTTDAHDPSTHNPYRAVDLGGLGDQPDLITNYMDYGYDECKNAFTNGQKERMVSSIRLIRQSLLVSKGCKDPCPAPIDIVFSASNTSVVTGTNVQFTNTTIGATNYQWRMNGTQFSNVMNPDFLFTQQGRFNIVLTATNGNDVCTVRDSILIQVDCNTKATFTGLQKIKPGETISFTNTTAGAVSYKWIVDGVAVSTDQHFSYTFPDAGGFAVDLIAYNGTCYDTARKFIEVSACNPSNPGDTWYFGVRAGMKFSDGKVTGIELPVSNESENMDTFKGCVSMSDADGNFIFFANAWYAFNKDLKQMPNGFDITEERDVFSHAPTQMAAIQNPGNPNRYYLFTLDAFDGPYGFRYSEIDMTLDGGLGDIVTATKNTFIRGSVTSRITTIKHANGNDTWVIVHGSSNNVFYTYLVTNTGISATPVTSIVGTIHNNAGGNADGQLKASPDGCKLAMAIYGMSVLELFDFNNATGTISNPVTFDFYEGNNLYGVEFSPNGSKLYVGMMWLQKIYQFDLNAGSQAAIDDSRYLVATMSDYNRPGAFQIGPYGKIYIARTGPYVAVINNPNRSGADCGFVSDAIYLGPNASGVNSLPSFSQSYFYDPSPSISGPEMVCANSKNVVYRISGSTCSTSDNLYTIQGEGIIVSSSAAEVKINFKQEGTAKLIVERISPCGKSYDSLVIVIKKAPAVSLKDTTQCTAANIVLDAGPGFTTYQWQDNSTLQTYTATVPGKYWVRLSNGLGCEITDTVSVFSKTIPVVDLGNDLTICGGKIVLLDAGAYAYYEWQDYFPERTYSAFLPGKYWVKVMDQCGASASDTIVIAHADSSSIHLGTDSTLCTGETIVLDAGMGFENYTWQDGSTTQRYPVSSPGQYAVIVTTEKGCKSIGKISISESNNCCNSDEIPNLVTLNGDGLNDTFILPCQSQDWSLEIYNRWGNMIYGSKEYRNEWPDTNVPDGVYYFLVKKESKSYRGWVEVVR